MVNTNKTRYFTVPSSVFFYDKCLINPKRHSEPIVYLIIIDFSINKINLKIKVKLS